MDRRFLNKLKEKIDNLSTIFINLVALVFNVTLPHQ